MTNRYALLFVWVLFVGYSLASSSIPGVNEPHYLSKARSFVQPDWCQRDFFLASQNAHYCFYRLIGPLTQWMTFSAVSFCGRAVSLLLFAWGWCRLSSRLGLSACGTSFASLIYLILVSYSQFSGEWIVGGFESKVPAWGFGLVAVSMWPLSFDVNRRRQLALSGALLGAAVSIHPVIGIWFVVALGISELSLRIIRPFRRHSPADDQTDRTPDPADSGVAAFSTPSPNAVTALVTDVLCFSLPCVVIALPGLLPAIAILNDDSVSEANRNLASFIQVFWRLRHHLDPTEFSRSAWITTGGLLLLIVGAERYLRWSARRTNAAGNTLPCVLLLTVLLLVSMVIAGTGIAIGWHTVPAKEIVGWEWRASLLKFYPFRLMDGLVPIVAALFLAAAMQTLWPVLFRWLPKAVRQCSQRFCWLSVALGGTVWLVWTAFAASSVPGGYNAEQFDDWKDVCDWIGKNTPADSLFVTPRESFAFKWLAERAEYVVYKDCPQDAAGILEWNRRLWYLNGWTLQSSKDGVYSEADLRKLRTDTGADFLLTRTLGPFETAADYRGRIWQLHRLPESNPE